MNSEAPASKKGFTHSLFELLHEVTRSPQKGGFPHERPTRRLSLPKKGFPRGLPDSKWRLVPPPGV